MITNAANRARSEHAALYKVEEARKALRTMRKFDGHPITRKWPGAFNTYYETLVPRVSCPRASLAEIAAKLGLTKDAYSARLRRALAYAQRLEEIA